MQLNKFKTLLQQEKESLMIFIKNHHHHDIDFDGDETDEIQAKIIARSNAQLLARKQEKLIKIDTAIRKIEAGGNFGQCEECGDDIAEKRLLFNPGFNTCISCAEELELMKKNQVR